MSQEEKKSPLTRLILKILALISPKLIKPYVEYRKRVVAPTKRINKAIDKIAPEAEDNKS